MEGGVIGVLQRKRHILVVSNKHFNLNNYLANDDKTFSLSD
ncbi:hypothetical protein [Paenibacillus sp. A3]|nr:hypothetical protein [Paenibacillus sp. A3]